MDIRAATAQDYEFVLALNADVQALHAEAEPHMFKPPSRDTMSRDTFDTILSSPTQHIYIGRIDDVPGGYMHVEIREEPENAVRYAARYLLIHQLGVSTAYRSKGYGTQLQQTALTLARSEGIKRIDLSVWAFNERAHAFYTKLGFRDMFAHLTMNDNE